MWIQLAICSSLFLACYDIAKKNTVTGNAVLPVLFLSTVFGCLPWAPFLILSASPPNWLKASLWYVPPADLYVHGLILIKAAIVAASWIFAFFSMKHLPLSIVAPLRASQPVWTLLGAVLLFHEHPSSTQWLGLSVTLGSYVALSRVGNKEGITFHRNRWVLCILLATLIGAVSALYDKYLLRLYPAALVQAWFQLYLVVILAPITLILWVPHRKQTTPFQWRWTLPLIGLSLVVADFLYFSALRDPASMISIVSTVRRSNVIFSFGIGTILFKEKNKRWKALCLAGILAGVIIIVLGR